MTVVVGDGCGVSVCVGGSAAVMFLLAAGDRLVAAHFSLCPLFFLPLVFLLAFLKRRCHRFTQVYGDDAGNAKSSGLTSIAEERQKPADIP